LTPGYLKEAEKCSYPLSTSGESNFPEYFCHGNVFQIMTPLDAVKSTAMKTKSIGEPKSASAENSNYTKKSLLIVRHQHQKRNLVLAKNHVLASSVIKNNSPRAEFENYTKIPKRKKIIF